MPVPYLSSSSSTWNLRRNQRNWDDGNRCKLSWLLSSGSLLCGDSWQLMCQCAFPDARTFRNHASQAIETISHLPFIRDKPSGASLAKLAHSPMLGEEDRTMEADTLLQPENTVKQVMFVWVWISFWYLEEGGGLIPDWASHPMCRT
jgi:hypothetical protein